HNRIEGQHGLLHIQLASVDYDVDHHRTSCNPGISDVLGDCVWLSGAGSSHWDWPYPHTILTGSQTRFPLLGMAAGHGQVQLLPCGWKTLSLNHLPAHNHSHQHP